MNRYETEIGFGFLICKHRRNACYFAGGRHNAAAREATP